MGGQKSWTGLLAALGVLTAAGVANSYVPMTMPDGSLVRWWNPGLTFRVGATVPQEVDLAAIPDMMLGLFDQWVGTSCGLVPEVTFAGASPATGITNPNTTDPDNVVVFLTRTADWAALQRSSSELAITLVARAASGQIVDADIAVNDAGHVFTLADSAGVGEIRLQTVLVHEAGHFFGLDHSLEADAVMNASYNLERDTLTPDDEAGMCFLYTDVPPLPVPDTGGDGGGCTNGRDASLGLAALGLLAFAVGRGRRVARTRSPGFAILAKTSR